MMVHLVLMDQQVVVRLMVSLEMSDTKDHRDHLAHLYVC